MSLLRWAQSYAGRLLLRYEANRAYRFSPGAPAGMPKDAGKE